MSAQPRTIQAAPGVGPLVAVFAALLAGTALIVALAYGQLTSSQTTLAPAAAPAPAVAHDHGWSASSLSTVPAVHDHGWSTTTRGPVSVGRDSGWIDTTPIRPAAGNTFDKAHAPGAASQRVEERGFGSNRVRLAQ